MFMLVMDLTSLFFASIRQGTIADNIRKNKRGWQEGKNK